MGMNNEIIKVINDTLLKKSEFEFVVGLEDLTLSDIDRINELSTVKSKFSYQIVDNTYIKINYSS